MCLLWSLLADASLLLETELCHHGTCLTAALEQRWWQVRERAQTTAQARGRCSPQPCMNVVAKLFYKVNPIIYQVYISQTEAAKHGRGKEEHPEHSYSALAATDNS